MYSRMLISEEEGELIYSASPQSFWLERQCFTAIYVELLAQMNVLQPDSLTARRSHIPTYYPTSNWPAVWFSVIEQGSGAL
jgi:hypothetical protein